MINSKVLSEVVVSTPPNPEPFFDWAMKRFVWAPIKWYLRSWVIAAHLTSPEDAWRVMHSDHPDTDPKTPADLEN